MSTLVVTDLDGTLWDYSDQCHPATLDAVAELQRQGIPLLAATGRRQRGVEIGFEVNQLALPAVMLNGGAGFDFRSNTGIFQQRFEPAEITELVIRLEQAGLSPGLQISPDRVVAQADPTLADKYVAAVGDCLLWTPNLEEFASDPEVNVVGFTMMSMSAEEIERCRTVMQSLDHDSFSYHLDNYYPGWMVMGQAPGVNKWTGIQRYLEQSLVEVDRLVVVGDNANDLPMLERADLAVGVEGGHPEVLSIAHETVKSPSEGGWASILDLLS